ncbi:MAG TPA: hypothetical protein PKI32_03210 [Opitutales bacterium]|nr:hypothetical protein [Opitutales bacterium]
MPSLDLLAARDLMDCGFCHMDDLRGRSPSAIMDSVRKLRPETPADRLWVFRMMVYLAENEDPDPRLLNPHAWSNRDY